MVAVALPLAPLAPGAAAAAGTFVAGSVAYIAQQVYGFRAPARAPSIPRTGGKAGGPTLQELVADVIAGARIPVALPPNPLGPQGSLGLAGLVAAAEFLGPRLSQLWGLFGSRSVQPLPDHAYPPGPTKTTGGNFLSLRSSVGTWAAFMEFVSLINTGRPGNYGTTYWRLTRRLADGSVVSNELPRSEAEIAALYLQCGAGRVCTTPNVVPAVPAPGAIPKIEPAVTPMPAPVIPLPAAPPSTDPLPQPETAPEPSVVPTTPGPAAPPATAPQVPRRTVPLPLPGATPTKDGAIVPQAPAPAAVTPPDAHFPVPGAPPVTGNGPRPTPEGIAQELGRLEQKLARLSDPGPAGNGDGTDRLGLLFQILGNVVEFLTSIQSGGGYELSSPCELDDNGDRIVTTVEYSGAPTTLGVVLNKLDALAALLQVHKDLKQPICKQTPAVGQPVTVNFVQVD